VNLPALHPSGMFYRDGHGLLVALLGVATG